MDQLKEAFQKVKYDISYLYTELSSLKSDIFSINSKLDSLIYAINELKQTPTHPSRIPTHPANPTDNPTVPMEIRGLKYQNFNTSIGNEGVPTDKPTNQQTDNLDKKTINDSIFEASEMLNSLDSLKKQIRLKFKSITKQEMLVFSTIYLFEEQGLEEIDYSKLASKLGLSQSSIRDYVLKLQKKGIPIEKQRLNNKKIHLRISPDLKKIASLDTILKLREL